MSSHEPLWGYRECATASGVAESTLRSYKAAGRLPDPDDVTLGHPRWRRDRFLAWQASRPGRGNWRRT